MMQRENDRLRGNIRIFLFEERKKKRRILALGILAELREAGIPLPYSPIAANPQVRRNSLFRRGKYLIPRPRGKTGYCQWLAATTTTTCHIPHPAISATWGGSRGRPSGPRSIHAPGKSYFDQEANLMYFIDFALRAKGRGGEEKNDILSFSLSFFPSFLSVHILIFSGKRLDTRWIIAIWFLWIFNFCCCYYYYYFYSRFFF